MMRKKILCKRQDAMRARQRRACNRGGRPPLPLSAAQVFELALRGESNAAIARTVGCDPKTLHRFALPLAFARLLRTHYPLEVMEMLPVRFPEGPERDAREED